MAISACAGRVVPPGEGAIGTLHERYSGKRFTAVTFLQRTESSNGTQLWYEAIKPFGKVRVDIAPLASSNGFMYRGDSMYVFTNGQVSSVKSEERWISMLLLVDIYALPLARVLQRLRDLGVDLGRVHNTTWNNRPTLVVGALSGDTTSAQAWLDSEHFYPVRIVQPPHSSYPRIDFQIRGHRYLAGGWIETEIAIVIGGKMVTRECYGEIRPNATLPDDLFEPSQFSTRRWAEAHYPAAASLPECPS